MVSRFFRLLSHVRALAGAAASPPQRVLLRRMVAFSRALPAHFAEPLPQMMARLTPASAPAPLDPDTIRRLADAVAAGHLRSPLGICLRRSLLRYYFLREAGLPVQVVFGARLKSQADGGGLGGHAWLTLHGAPYHENPADYQNFAAMLIYPPDPPA